MIIKDSNEFAKGLEETQGVRDELPRADNLHLWDKVQETNPNYTKKANVKGNKITSISPQFQILMATEQFGVYGSTWGFKSMKFDYTLKDLGMIVFESVFFHPYGEFPIVNSVQLYRDGAMTKIDDDFAKKVETDTLTKALSKLGFSADIFMGKFDDTKYFTEMQEKYKPQAPKKDKPNDSQFSVVIDWVSKGKWTKQKAIDTYKLSDKQIEQIEQIKQLG